MPQTIPSATTPSVNWGTAREHAQVPMPAHTPAVLGAMLDFSISALEVVETQLLWNLSFSVTPEVRSLLYIYFGLTVGSDAKPAVGRLIDVYRQTRTGLEGEKGTMEIIQTDPSFGSTYAGYVTQSFFSGTMSPIHLRFQKLTDSSIMFGAPIHANLLVHEATHRYAKTIDTPVQVPTVGKTLAYLNVCRTNVLTTYGAAADKAKARQDIAGKVMSYISHADALNNADSYAWFMTAMVESYADTLGGAFKFTRMKTDLGEAADQFAKVQKTVLGKDMFPMANVFKVT